MNTSEASVLADKLDRIDGQGYGRYASICGTYALDGLRLQIDRTQRDPFASPTMMRVFASVSETGVDVSSLESRIRSVALADYLTRRLAVEIDELGVEVNGSGNSGRIHIARPGQEVVERTSVQIKGAELEARVYAGLPARGRRIDGRGAEVILLEALPGVLAAALSNLRDNPDAVKRPLNVCEDQDDLRSRLADMGLVAFVADGSILVRESGADDRPMDSDTAVPLVSPPSTAVEVELPHRGRVRGLGIPVGVTMIVGGGYHGKSTLLKAVERGVYNHIPGDGREGVVTVDSAVKLRAEEGRSVQCVDLRPFIDNLPGGVDAVRFSTQDASGSTSQAASVVEYVAGGATALLMDEDSSASNFLNRDEGVRSLVPDSEEPIRPYASFVRGLVEQGVSTLMAIGSSSTFFAWSDLVLRVADYRVEDVTEVARQLSDPEANACEGVTVEKQERVPSRWDFGRGRRGPRVRVRGPEVSIGDEHVDVSGLEQLCAPGAAECVGAALFWCASLIDGQRSIDSIAEEIEGLMAREGLDGLGGRLTGNAARARRLDILGALNRARRLKVG